MHLDGLTALVPRAEVLSAPVAVPETAPVSWMQVSGSSTVWCLGLALNAPALPRWRVLGLAASWVLDA